MEWARKSGIMGQRHTLGNFMKGRRMEEGSLFGVMDHTMKESLLMDCLMGMVYIISKIVRKRTMEHL
jgi:hypothetical protein